MSRTVLEQRRDDIPVVASTVLLDHLVHEPRWHDKSHLWAAVCTNRSSAGYDAWDRLLLALEATGDIIIARDPGQTCVRISTAGWLRAVQRGADARSGAAVPV